MSYTIVKDEFGSKFRIEEGMDYSSLRKNREIIESRCEKERLKNPRCKPKKEKPPEQRYLTRVVNMDSNGRLYVNYGSTHVYCFHGTADIKVGDSVFVDSNWWYTLYDIYGVSKDGVKFETWRTKISRR